jgi:hypothetical protein
MGELISIEDYKLRLITKVASTFTPTYPDWVVDEARADRLRGESRTFPYKEAKSMSFNRIKALWKAMSDLNDEEKSVVMKAWKLCEISIIVCKHEP